MTEPRDPNCIFRRIIAGEVDREYVFWEDEVAIGLLDHRPLKPGHALLIPKAHYVTIKDLPRDLLGPFFDRAAVLARAVEVAFDADGSFSGYNTHVSQSVDHFHLHVVPRTFGDKLFSGGKWVRIPVKDKEVQRQRRDALGEAMRRLMAPADVP
jgi:histidine triad (HIT) family protein